MFVFQIASDASKKGIDRVKAATKKALLLRGVELDGFKAARDLFSITRYYVICKGSDFQVYKRHP